MEGDGRNNGTQCFVLSGRRELFVGVHLGLRDLSSLSSRVYRNILPSSKERDDKKWCQDDYMIQELQLPLILLLVKT
ncbi:unnamed protein product [Prunus armeniaca]|uniref:Uncharacterized protein n=1 Tax=Prunus armeniaca TaxID=36596 RepID=A0A6J5VYI3_PRUAR|nr:unnamed protein product [Prunus armeniaca]CAB4294370.1 unnamed protein product [Prunus armeniaca]